MKKIIFILLALLISIPQNTYSMDLFKCCRKKKAKRKRPTTEETLDKLNQSKEDLENRTASNELKIIELQKRLKVMVKKDPRQARSLAALKAGCENNNKLTQGFLLTIKKQIIQIKKKAQIPLTLSEKLKQTTQANTSLQVVTTPLTPEEEAEFGAELDALVKETKTE